MTSSLLYSSFIYVSCSRECCDSSLNCWVWFTASNLLVKNIPSREKTSEKYFQGHFKAQPPLILPFCSLLSFALLFSSLLSLCSSLCHFPQSLITISHTGPQMEAGKKRLIEFHLNLPGSSFRLLLIERLQERKHAGNMKWIFRAFLSHRKITGLPSRMYSS